MNSTDVGFCADLDVDLSLEAEDGEPCMLADKGCPNQAVMQAILTAPCGHPQPLCLPHYERVKPRWLPGDPTACGRCFPGGATAPTSAVALFVRWERL